MLKMLIVKRRTLADANSLHKLGPLVTALLFILSGTKVVAAKSPSDFPRDGIEVSFFKTTSSPFASGKTSGEKLQQTVLAESKTLPGDVKYYHHGRYYLQTELNPTTAAKLASSTTAVTDLRDFGQFLVIVDTPLLAKPSVDAAKLTKIYSGTLLKLVPSTIERFQKGFVKVRFSGIDGFVNISHTISKFDFAVWIFPKATYKNENLKTSSNNGWMQVKTRLFDEIETTDGQFIHLSEIEGLWTDAAKGIISSISEPFPLWTHIRVFPAAPVVWKSSRLPGHHVVWWRESDLKASINSKNSPSSKDDEITIDEILKKEIFSVSFHPKNPRKALVSAGGVYHTTDGQTWKKLKQFDHFSGPVHYFKDLMMFVGPYRTVNGGQTFENFIRIDELTHSITSVLGYSPQRLELRSIKTTSTLKIIMEIDIGSRKIKVQSPIYAQNWSVLRAGSTHRLNHN